MRLLDYNKDPIGEYMRRVRIIESGGNDKSKSKTSSATGRYQFTSSTWKQAEKALGKKLNIYDGDDQDEAMRWLTNENAKALKSMGVSVTPTNLYMAHFLGRNGVKRFFDAYAINPNAPVTSFITSAEYNANKSLFTKGNTLSKLYDMMGKKVGRTPINREDSTAYGIPTNSNNYININNNTIDHFMQDGDPLFAESNRLMYSTSNLENDVHALLNGMIENEDRMRQLIESDKDMLALDEKNKERAFLSDLISTLSEVDIVTKNNRKI